MQIWLLPAIAVAALVVLALLGLACRALLRNPRGDVEGGLVWLALRLYVRFVHGLTVRGREHVPQEADGPLLIVSTHGAGIDPLLMQAAFPRRIIFMMASDMMLPAFMPFWEWVGVIPVDREGGDTRAAREAIRRLKQGNVVAIFPEGKLVREIGFVAPFLPGVGLIVRRSGARVLPMVIEGTPRVSSAWGSLWRRSRSRVTLLPVVDYGATELSAEEIASDLRSRMQAGMSGPSVS